MQCKFLLIALFATAVANAAYAGERIFQLDLIKHQDAGDKADIVPVGENTYEWTLPDGIGQSINIDLPVLGVDPHDYDELRFDIKPLGSQVMLQAMLFHMPKEGELSSWYSKFRMVTGEWSLGRFDLRVDDDGVQKGRGFGDVKQGLLRLMLARRSLGFPGEPQWRKAIIRNPRLVRWAVSADFEPRDLDFISDDAIMSYTYGLRVENRTEQPLTAKVDIDPDGGVRYFRAEIPVAEGMPVKPG